jgi:hypothetical protein
LGPTAPTIGSGRGRSFGAFPTPGHACSHPLGSQPIGDGRGYEMPQYQPRHDKGVIANAAVNRGTANSDSRAYNCSSSSWSGGDIPVKCAKASGECRPRFRDAQTPDSPTRVAVTRFRCVVMETAEIRGNNSSKPAGRLLAAPPARSRPLSSGAGSSREERSDVRPLSLCRAQWWPRTRRNNSGQ